MEATTDELQGRTPLDTDAQLHRVLQCLLTSAILRQIWLFLLSDDGRLIEPIMPMKDLPLDAHEMEEFEGVGLVTAAEACIHRLRWVAEHVGAGSYAIVWERPGSDKYTAEDLDWITELTNFAGEPTTGARLRAMFLLHDKGLRQIAPDDYA